MSLNIGTATIDALKLGASIIDAVYIGSTIVYSAALRAPTISLTNGILTIVDNDGNATNFDIYVNGTVLLNIDKGTNYHIAATTTNCTADASNKQYIVATTGSVELLYYFSNGYVCPTTSPTVTGATGTWMKVSDTQGKMTLTNVTGDVSFTIVGENAWEDPQQSGDTLSITQVYTSTQSGSTLTIQ